MKTLGRNKQKKMGRLWLREKKQGRVKQKNFEDVSSCVLVLGEKKSTQMKKEEIKIKCKKRTIEVVRPRVTDDGRV